MATVIRLAQRRSIARRDLPLELPAGDSDLLPIAGVLWLGSLVRVALALVHRQTFGVEATLASLCVLLLPLFMLRCRHPRDTAQQ